MIPLEKLGKRICIIGCSNSGKSTFARALAKRLHLPVYHLDQYAHIENTNWLRQSDEIFIEQHNQLIKQEAWIIEGNYSISMQQRFDRATSVIWLDPNVYSCVGRYLLRSLKNDKNRAGRLSNAKNEFRFWLIKWILFNYPKNRLKYKALLDANSHLTILQIDSIKLLNSYYVLWKLSRIL